MTESEKKPEGIMPAPQASLPPSSPEQQPAYDAHDAKGVDDLARLKKQPPPWWRKTITAVGGGTVLGAALTAGAMKGCDAPGDPENAKKAQDAGNVVAKLRKDEEKLRKDHKGDLELRDNQIDLWQRHAMRVEQERNEHEKKASRLHKELAPHRTKELQSHLRRVLANDEEVVSHRLTELEKSILLLRELDEIRKNLLMQQLLKLIAIQAEPQPNDPPPAPPQPIRPTSDDIRAEIKGRLRHINMDLQDTIPVFEAIDKSMGHRPLLAAVAGELKESIKKAGLAETRLFNTRDTVRIETLAQGLLADNAKLGRRPEEIDGMPDTFEWNVKYNQAAQTITSLLELQRAEALMQRQAAKGRAK